MNFQGLLKIEDPDFYLDLAFRRAKQKTNTIRDAKLQGDRLKKSKYIESIRINVVKDSLINHLEKILLSFPNIRDLPKFYRELIRCTLEYDELKLSLGIVSWAEKRINSFYKKYNDMINKTKELERVNAHRREFYGRVSSIMRQTKKSLRYIETARRVMREYPNVKTSLKTISLIGFPNVGKTTLLYKLTGSKPEISSYAFTTKGINIGYIGKKGKSRIQVLDTPGTLNRFEKMNNVERVAYLAMKYVSDAFVYVFDLTETSYDIKEQKKLFKNIAKLNRPLIVFVNKTDITDKKAVEEFQKKIKSITDVKELSRQIEQILKGVVKEEDIAPAPNPKG